MSRNSVAVLTFAAVLVTLGLVSMPCAWGQGAVTTGSIIGDVSDATGAAVAGAKAVVQIRATGLHREQLSDSNGRFIFSQLPAGKYEIEVAAAGLRHLSYKTSNSMLTPRLP